MINSYLKLIFLSFCLVQGCSSVLKISGKSGTTEDTEIAEVEAGKDPEASNPQNQTLPDAPATEELNGVATQFNPIEIDYEGFAIFAEIDFEVPISLLDPESSQLSEPYTIEFKVPFSSYTGIEDPNITTNLLLLLLDPKTGNYLRIDPALYQITPDGVNWLVKTELFRDGLKVFLAHKEATENVEELSQVGIPKVESFSFSKVEAGSNLLLFDLVFSETVFGVESDLFIFNTTEASNPTVAEIRGEGSNYILAVRLDSSLGTLQAGLTVDRKTGSVFAPLGGAGSQFTPGDFDR